MTTKKVHHEGSTVFHGYAGDADVSANFDTVTNATVVAKAGTEEYRYALITTTDTDNVVEKELAIDKDTGWLELRVMPGDATFSIDLVDGDGAGIKLSLTAAGALSYNDGSDHSIATLVSSAFSSLDISLENLTIRVNNGAPSTIAPSGTPAATLDLAISCAAAGKKFYLAGINHSSASPAIRGRIHYLRESPAQAVAIWIATNWATVAAWTCPTLLLRDVDDMEGLNLVDLGIVIREDILVAQQEGPVPGQAKVRGYVELRVTHPAFQLDDDYPFWKNEAMKNCWALLYLCQQCATLVPGWGGVYINSGWQLSIAENDRCDYRISLHLYKGTLTSES
ncbi:MAG: hypothetical protein JW839_02145 [Candidatus Lokiarchaeota archaeon]|nr:hypothetical protein [Candidatus Lokiarchaeota archaeon]